MALQNKQRASRGARMAARCAPRYGNSTLAKAIGSWLKAVPALHSQMQYRLNGAMKKRLNTISSWRL